MSIIQVILLFLSIFKVCVSLEDLWHSYHYDPIHKSREEILITNVTTDNEFIFEHVVTKWKSLCGEKECYLAGLMEKNVSIISVKIDSQRKKFINKVYTIELNVRPIDLELFSNWNSSSQSFETIAVIATEKPELVWYKIKSTESTLFWSWSTHKKISHINLFQKEYDYQLLIINQHLSSITADLYEFVLEKSPNFWLRQKIKLLTTATCSALNNVGPNYFLTIPQNDSLSIYKYTNSHFTSFTNITSKNVNKVVAFKIGEKSFMSFNGLNAGIYQFATNGLTRQDIKETHSIGVNFWLPISLTVYGDDALLVAQRSLKHDPHNSFVIEMITYNGDKFEEHEDIPCLYFGEEVLGLSCLTDEYSKNGIEGSASIFLNDYLAILVPKHNRSELFLVDLEIKKNSNPLIKEIEQLQTKKEEITKLITAQDEKFDNLVRSSNIDNFDLISEEIENMKKEIQEMSNSNSKFDTIIFNGLVKIETSGVFDEVETENINGQPAKPLLEDIANKNNLKTFTGKKYFTNLESKDLSVDNINGINANDIVYYSDNITINDNLFVTKPLKVSNVRVTDIDNQVLDSLAESSQFEDIFLPNDKSEFDILDIPNNLEVDKINGEPFDEFLQKLCLTNINTRIPGVFSVQGDVTILENANIDNLNNLAFPSGYAFTDDESLFITGFKSFTDLTVSELHLDGTIDDISPSDIITLNTAQNISETVTFMNLKITEGLNINGKVLGDHASKFLPNLPIYETDTVKSKVHFKNLEVDGVVIINYFNGKNLEAQLNDIIYDDEESVVIEAMKEFPEGFTVLKNLAINSKKINNFSLDQIVTKNTDQTLNLSTIHGIVTFENIESELYDSVDVKTLDEELVKLDGEQYISSTLIFEDELEVNTLQVLENVTKYGVSRDLFTEDTVNFENIIVQGNVYGNIDNFNLFEFDKFKLSLTKDQEVESQMIINKCIADNMVISKLNKVDVAQLTGKNLKEYFISKLVNDDLEVENMHIKNSVEIERINNQPVINLEGSFWKHGTMKSKINKIIFNDDVTFDNVEIEKLSSVNFTKYIDNIVFKNETDVKLSGRKVFLKGLTVEKLIETQKLNHIPLSNILTKHGKQDILGPITVEGNVWFKDNVTISSFINNIPIESISEFKNENDILQIQGDVLLSRRPQITNLEIEGYVNQKNVQETLESIVYKNVDVTLNGLTTFENTVSIDKNLRVNGKFNNVEFLPFISDMILITKDTTIVSPLEFRDEIEVTDKIVLNSSLQTTLLNNVNINAWMNKSVFVDNGFLPGSYTFDEVEIVDTLITERINNINVSTLIPLRTQQILPELNFNRISVFNNVEVGNSTNYYNLPQEFSNSVMINDDQSIESDVEFVGRVFIEGDCKLGGTLNNIKIDKIVTTNTDQELEAVYEFKTKTNLKKNLVVDGLVNGIDIEKWVNESVKTISRYPQDIVVNWNIAGDVIFEENCNGTGLINNISLQNVTKEVQEKRQFRYQVEKGFINDYKNMCQDLTFMHDRLKKQIYRFDYMEKLPFLRFHKSVEFVFSYEYQNNIYLIVNEAKNCDSYLFVLETEFRYMRTVHFGLVAQIIPVLYNDLTYHFIVRNQPHYSLCKYQGTNLWELTDSGFRSLSNIEDQDILQDSKAPGTFYGLKGNTITEFQIRPNLDLPLKRYRKWTVKEDNMAFVPRGLKTGLSLQTGKKLIKLNREESIVDNLDSDTEEIVVGNYSEEFNTYFPGRKGSDLVVMKVGIKSSKRNLLAVASHEETSVKGSLDFIKIYEDVINGKLFHKVATYKPSSLISLDFENGETFLAFLEDESVLQVYEYKGIEGFKHKLSAKIEGSKLFAINTEKRKIIGVVDKNNVHLLEIVMLGNKVKRDFKCTL